VLLVWSFVLALLVGAAPAHALVAPFGPPHPAALDVGSCTATAPAPLHQGSATISVACSDFEVAALRAGVPPAKGTLQQNGPATEITYTVNAGATAGDDAFNLIASGPSGDSDPIPVTVTVTNAAPSCSAPAPVSVTKNAAGSAIAVACTDADGDPLTLSAGGGPAHGTLSAFSGGQATYTPAQGFSGSDGFSATAGDGHGATSAAQAIAITVVNHAPTCSGQTVSAPNATKVTISLSCTDPDGDPIAAVTLGTPSTGTVVHSPGAGVNVVDYTPPAGFTGAATFPFTASDNDAAPATSAPATVTVNVAPPPNRAPVCNAVDTATLHATAVDITLACTDPDRDAFTLAATGLTANSGTLSAVNGSKITYTPTATFAGTATFTYTATDKAASPATSAPATVTIKVNALPSCSIATPVNVDKNKTTTLAITCTDPDSATAPTIAVSAAPTNGTFDPKTKAYTPNTGFSGNDPLTVVPKDDKGQTGTGLTVPVAVVNHAPVCTQQSVGTPYATPMFVSVSCKDPDGDAIGKYTATSGAHGQVRHVLNDPPERFQFTPESSYSGPASFSVVAADNDINPLTSSPATIAVNIAPQGNQPPTCDAVPALTVPKNTAADTTFKVTCHDPENGPVKVAIASIANNGDVKVLDDGVTVRYRVHKGWSGPDPFVVVGVDNQLLTSAQMPVDLTVGPNHTPACSDQAVTVAAGAAITIPLQCTDPDGDALQYAVADAPGLGTLTTASPTSVTYAAGAYGGSDAFTFRASDDDPTTPRSSPNATVRVTVNGPARPTGGEGGGGGSPDPGAGGSPGTGNDGGSRPVAQSSTPATQAKKPAISPVQQAITLLGGSAAPLDLGFGGKLKLYLPVETIKAGKPVTVVVCASCTVWVSGVVTLTGLPAPPGPGGIAATATPTDPSADPANPATPAAGRQLRLAQRSAHGKAGTAVAIRLTLSSAQRTLIRKAHKATVRLEIRGTVGGRIRTAHRTLRLKL
jgi:large repetitive protein